ncbi:MAG: hypothetical protein EXQ55_04540 [Acidobacteria bacterium]|nr:hypothetical protein [Acidobacteriota bacterium]
MQAPSPGIIVQVVDSSELSGLADVIIGAVGLTGIITLGSLVLGMVLAGLFIGYRTLQARSKSADDLAQTQALGLTTPARKS